MKGQLNIDSISRTAYNATSELAGRTFTDAFAILARAFNQHLQIERSEQGDSFDAEAFWQNHAIAESVILSTTRKPKTNASGEPILRKGQPVYVTSQFNKRVIVSAASIIRSGVRSTRALAVLTRKAASLEQAVIEADKLGAVLSLVRRLAACGLVADNKAANTAKTSAIGAYTGETPSASARTALMVSLYGQPVTSAQVATILDSLKKWEAERASRRNKASKEHPFVAPDALTFAGVLGTVVSIKRERKPKANQPEVSTETQPEAVNQ